MSVTNQLRLETVDGRIAELMATLDRTRANLFELDTDVTRRLLEASTVLRGATATAWTDASRRYADLWRGQLALESVLERITQERGNRRSATAATLSRLTLMLDEPSVPMPREASTKARQLTDKAEPIVECTIAQALSRMSSDYDVVANVVRSVAAVWGESPDHFDQLEHRIVETEDELRALELRRPNELDQARRALADAEELAREDPLSLASEATAEIESVVRRVEQQLLARGDERRQRQDDLDSARALVAELPGQLVRCRDEVRRYAAKVHLRTSVYETLARAPEEIEELTAALAGAGEQATQPESSAALARRSASLLDRLRRRRRRVRRSSVPATSFEAASRRTAPRPMPSASAKTSSSITCTRAHTTPSTSLPATSRAERLVVTYENAVHR